MSEANEGTATLPMSCIDRYGEGEVRMLTSWRGYSFTTSYDEFAVLAVVAGL